MRADSASERDLDAARAHLRLFMFVAQTGRGWDLLRSSTAEARASTWATYVFLPDSSPHTRWFGRHATFDPAPLLQRIFVPVLAMYGAEDVIVPPTENVERLRRFLQRARNTNVSIHVLPSADHRLEVSSGRDARGRWHWFGIAPAYFDLVPTWLRRQAKSK